MAQIFPFRGIRYDPERVELSQVVAQPYDKISPKMQEEYYRSSPYNMVRIILNREQGERRYQEARESLERWLNEGILLRDSRPTIYACYQDYEAEDRMRLVRKGFVALFKLSEYGEEILPHERTLQKPKEDRINLMRATKANLGQVFVLYSDRELSINRILDRFILNREPLRAIDRFDSGTIHHLWPIQEGAALEEIVEAMLDKTLFIADGHHRYETALAYRDEMETRGEGCPGPESYENVMLTFVNMDDRGLSVFPTHRLLHRLKEPEARKLEGKLSSYFQVDRFKLGERERLLRALKEKQERGQHAFGLGLHGFPQYYLLTLRDEEVMDELVPDRSPEWRALDVVICHYLLLGKIFDIGPDEVEERVGYSRGAGEALDLVQEGQEVTAVLLNPTRPEEVRLIARNGERMPQKSTDFYPKMLAGLILNRLCYLGD
jgi:uncharacterized protein (DUF1015 family)